MSTDTPTQVWNPSAYAKDAGFVAVLGEPLIALLDPQPGERVLDLGCGDGALTEKLVARGCRVTAVDASPEQVEAARARGLDAHVGDGAALTFSRAFDAVFSNATLHWIREPDRVIAGVARALVPGGRFVAELGGAGNVHAIRAALAAGLAQRGIDAAAHDPWYFPSPEEYGARLEAGGFVVDRIEHFARPTPLPGDVVAWLDVFAQSFVAALPAGERDAYVREVRSALRPALEGPDGVWTADYVRLRVVAHLPARA